jgi:hypothetical protein
MKVTGDDEMLNRLSDVPPRFQWKASGGQFVRSAVVHTVGIAVLCTIAAWFPHDVYFSPTTGVDPSWQVALSMAFVHHIAWGPRIDFTYGPLGFLSQQTLFFGSTAALSLIYLAVVITAMFALLIHWSRKSFTLPFAVAVSYIIGATAVAFLDPGDLVMIPVTLFGMLCIAHSDLRRRQIGIAVLGVAAAACLLGKFSDGVVATAVLVAVVAAGQGLRRLVDTAIAGVALAATIVVAWVLTGNSLGNLGEFLRNAISLSGGYSSAMQLEIGRTDEWWYALVATLVIAVVATLGFRQSYGRVRIASVVVLLAVTWWAFKEGFVRHDAHDLIFFGFVPILLLVVPIPTSRLRPCLAAAIAFLIVIAWTVAGSVPSNVLAVLHDANGLRTELTTVFSSRSRTAAIDAARQTMQQTYRIDPAQLRELVGHTVAIEPFENAVAWAYPSITWDPEPVVQAYSAYTSSLDQLDAAFLRSDAAPSRILEQPPVGVDGRDPFFEPPTTWVTMMCHYAQLDATARWQVLGRVPDRCGSLRLVKRVSATFGQKVAIPDVPTGDAVVARFLDVPLSVGYKVSSVLLKPPTASIDTSAGRLRFIIATAGDLHLLRPSSSIGYSAPFTPPVLDSFALTGAGVHPGARRYEVEFYTLPVLHG